jgi:hypothetical protein
VILDIIAGWGSQMMPFKIFGIGLNKTGTKTLKISLETLFSSRHVSCRRDLLIDFREGRLDRIFSVSDQNESFEDWPWPLLYREMFQRYGSNARFILTRRESSEKWLSSIKRHSLRTNPYNHCRLLAYGYSYPYGFESEHVAVYERHNQDVLEFFARHGVSNLLCELCWEDGDGWQKLCSFLNCPVPNLPFPRVADNQSSPFENQNRQLVKLQMQLLGKTL